jgi:exonuclease III
LEYGGSEGVLWLKYDNEEGCVGYLAAVYRDSGHMRDKLGMCEQSFIDGLEDGAERAADEGGWVVMAGDFNVWLGQEQENDENHRQGRPGDVACPCGRYLAKMMHRQDLLSVQGRRGVAEATRYTGSARATEIDYIVISEGLLPKLEAHAVQLHHRNSVITESSRRDSRWTSCKQRWPRREYRGRGGCC